MGVRQKLNIAYFHVSLLLASLLGWLTQSWSVLFITLTVLLGFNLYLRQIRPKKTNRRDGKG